MLSPYLNIFTSKSTILLPEDHEIEDLACPHCSGTGFIKSHESMAIEIIRLLHLSASKQQIKSRVSSGFAFFLRISI